MELDRKSRSLFLKLSSEMLATAAEGWTFFCVHFVFRSFHFSFCISYFVAFIFHFAFRILRYLQLEWCDICKEFRYHILSLGLKLILCPGGILCSLLKQYIYKGWLKCFFPRNWILESGKANVFIAYGRGGYGVKTTGN